MGIAFAITFSIGAVAALTRGTLAFSVAEAADPGISLSFYRMGGYLDTSRQPDRLRVLHRGRRGCRSHRSHPQLVGVGERASRGSG